MFAVLLQVRLSSCFCAWACEVILCILFLSILRGGCSGVDFFGEQWALI